MNIAPKFWKSDLEMYVNACMLRNYILFILFYKGRVHETLFFSYWLMQNGSSFI